MSLIITVLLILFLGEFVRSAIGFGNALIAMPLLILLLDLRTATPLFALSSLTGSLAILGLSWQHVHIGEAWRLNLGALLGIPVGLWILNHVPNEIGIAALAVLIITYGIYSLAIPSLPYLQNTRIGIIVGACAGVTSAAFNVAGPPVVIYGALRRWSPADFRATVQSFFFPTSIVVILGHGLSGLWTEQVWSLYPMTIPVVLLATIIGARVNRYFSNAVFGRAISGFLLIIGVFMLVQVW